MHFGRRGKAHRYKLGRYRTHSQTNPLRRNIQRRKTAHPQSRLWWLFAPKCP
ncbi:uncharacterized protein BO80DRAFT_429633 [Aspergillus ibericus CBS 121593]|uniref:Uncharacterized protein n=1 Tax=Aspergillus ibericus CBS 121593 TaxID=1448316 RepID=A0A395GJX4_9EURO|nr:hypothetical protein BO80DRAFT_429633 [Aspergillus ibericus CBS 121593]RAK95790.1 hypothetical protein BO80DRAFT_429633 [Aspergillus ibericus CBS 121593]